MTEFETATLALQHVTIAGQSAATAQTFWIGLGQIIVALAGTIVNAFLILRGFRLMSTEGRARAQEHADRHDETMRALEAMIRQSDIQSRALESLIERTAPPKS